MSESTHHKAHQGYSQCNRHHHHLLFTRSSISQTCHPAVLAPLCSAPPSLPLPTKIFFFWLCEKVCIANEPSYPTRTPTPQLMPPGGSSSGVPHPTTITTIITHPATGVSTQVLLRSASGSGVARVKQGRGRPCVRRVRDMFCRVRVSHQKVCRTEFFFLFFYRLGEIFVGAGWRPRLITRRYCDLKQQSL